MSGLFQQNTPKQAKTPLRPPRGHPNTINCVRVVKPHKMGLCEKSRSSSRLALVFCGFAWAKVCRPHRWFFQLVFTFTPSSRGQNYPIQWILGISFLWFCMSQSLQASSVIFSISIHVHTKLARTKSPHSVGAWCQILRVCLSQS